MQAIVRFRPALANYFSLAGLSLFLYFVIKLTKLDNMFHVFIDHWQYGDFTYTLANPVAALFFLHAQPPLLNAILYTTTLVSKTDFYDVFILLNCLCASITTIVIYRICKGYAPRLLSLLASAAYFISPAVLLYAAYPFYPTLTALGYALLAYSFYLIKFNLTRAVYLFLFAIFFLSLLRSSFTYLHGLLFLAVFFYQIRPSTNKKLKFTLAIGALFCLFVLPVKNYMLYNFFGSSSWAPQNLALGMGVHVAPKVFPSPREIREAYPELQCRYKYDWIDSTDLIKKDQVNYNSCYVLEFSRKHIPIILKNYDFTTHKTLVKENSFTYVKPSYDYFVLSAYNKSKLTALRAFYKKFSLTKRVQGKEVRISIIVVVLLSIILAGVKRDRFIGCLLAIIMIHFITVVTTDGKESDRFVFDIEFLIYILGCMVAWWIGRPILRLISKISTQ